MASFFSPPVLPPATAVLLVLLPPATVGEALPTAPTSTAILALQRRLGPSIRVLKIDEASHPAVVQSFGTPALPACVLVRQGVELWRHQGLPDCEADLRHLLEAAGPA